jgi:RNA polymerase sigma-70 factor (ECF subfamily)
VPAATDPLVEGLRRGEGSAFDRVYEEYRARLFAFLLRMTRQVQIAEDLLQETFLRLARSAARLAPDTRLASWLFTVAHNLCMSHFRGAAVERTGLAELGSRPPEAGRDPLEALAADESRRQLERALGSLPDRHREVLLLVGVEGMTPAEVAEILGEQAAAVRQRLHRARAMLSDALAVAGEERDVERERMR